VVVALDRRLVAVMFTDMAGYTALLQTDERLAIDRRERYWDALERHHEAFGGTIVQRLGDGSMSMFPSSLAAVQAAVAAQQELAPQNVLVRIGVHSGEVVVEPERLTGDAVNVAARIESFAVPGGVLLSDAAYEQIKNRSDVITVPLGRFRLKNVGRPFELFAVSADGLVVPDARALEGKGERFASLPSSLPTPSVPLVGRTDELAALTDLVRTQRVVTITGPGGVGKTRMLIELGWLLAAEFPDALAFITLADVSEPAAFLPTVATALDVKEAEERTLLDGIVSLIGDRPTLLLLDNVDQIVPVAPEVATLIERCPMLRIVVTSRAPLRLAAEHEFSLGPLALPSGSEGVSPESVATSPAVVLFVQRARSARGSFDVTADNAGAIAAICRRDARDGSAGRSGSDVAEGTLREHQRGHRSPREVTRLQVIPSSCGTSVPAASRPCPPFPLCCSMVRRGRRFEPVRGFREGPANATISLSSPSTPVTRGHSRALDAVLVGVPGAGIRLVQASIGVR
jgi:class 3 adenylate cyclase